jgi:tRNA wybutosine-synthesizing protein 4
MEALNGKASCVTKRYYQDRFLRLFRPSYPPPPAMSPLISRGYFTRVRALELIVQAFERQVLATTAGPSSTPSINLVLLGAGLDTLFFRLEEQHEKEEEKGALPQEALTRHYYEVDFAPVVQYKALCLRADKDMCQWLDVVEPGASPDDAPRAGVVLARSTSSGTTHNKRSSYALLAGDLADTAALEATFTHVGMDWSLPTLLIAECVLVYMEPEASQRLVEVSTSKCAMNPPIRRV